MVVSAHDTQHSRPPGGDAAHYTSIGGSTTRSMDYPDGRASSGSSQKRQKSATLLAPYHNIASTFFNVNGASNDHIFLEAARVSKHLQRSLYPCCTTKKHKLLWWPILYMIATGIVKSLHNFDNVIFFFEIGPFSVNCCVKWGYSWPLEDS